ncbi:MAG TPA: molybdopterin-dependent oxidoreductase [Archangium sp.]|jgi:DMSO/TMAO reductase YedYZ molybdopterin-dependent catalytic subunit|uniref:molybdopterin-dependent oxidoreductase n=1 Tax=Archangium sp. TaxID=1872627 RepID=UPI002ED9BE1A
MDDAPPYVTPNLERKPLSLRYYQEGIPTVNVEDWRLELVAPGGQKVSLTHAELLALPQTLHHRRLVCVCNWSIKRWWEGVLLRDVLAAAGIDTGAVSGQYLRQVSVGTPEKGIYESWISLAGALERQALLAVAVDGHPLPPEQGYPLRLIDFGLYAYKCVKGLTRLEVTTEARLGYWEELAGYSLDGTVKPKRYWSVDLRKHMLAEKPGEVTEW